MRGDACARHNLGLNEGRAGNHKRAYKHLMIAIRGGSNNNSLDYGQSGKTLHDCN